MGLGQYQGICPESLIQKSHETRCENRQYIRGSRDDSLQDL